MGKNPTHTSRLARAIADSSNMSYQQAFAVITDLRDRGRMPSAQPGEELAVQRDAVLDTARSQGLLDRGSASAATGWADQSFSISVNDDTVVALSGRELSTHTLILGAGSSNRELLVSRLIGQLDEAGWDGVVVDCESSSRFADSLGTPLRTLIVGRRGAYHLDPFFGLSVYQAVHLVLSLREFTDAYWHTVSRKVVTQFCTLLWAAHQVAPGEYGAPTLEALGALLDLGADSSTSAMIDSVVSAKPVEYSRADFDAVAAPGVNESCMVTEMAKVIKALYSETDAQSALSPDAGGSVSVSLDLSERGLVYLGCKAGQEALIGRFCGNVALNQLSGLCEKTTRGEAAQRRRFCVLIGAEHLDRHLLVELMARARSAGLAVILVSDGPTVWNSGAGVVGFDQLAQNTNVSMVLRQGSHEDAVACQDLLGYIVRESGDGQKVPVCGADQLEQMGSDRAFVKVAVPNQRFSSFAVREHVQASPV